MRVVIADDEMLLREGLARLLTEAGFEVVGKTADAAELLRSVRLTNPDVAIVDIRMPPTHTDEGLLAANEIRSSHPQTGVLVLSHYLESIYAQRLLEEHPERVGYLLKDRVSDVAEFVEGVRRVAAGGTVLDPEVIATIMARRQDQPLDRLTAREREVLGLMAEGRSNAAIAAAMFVTEKAVAKHTNSIFTKLDLPVDIDDNRRVLAVLAWLKV
jgi:DNA-binding NarL/FixJ family response regulator